ncbi:hypothetical protein PsorP6_008045 [Peronosclerospora sorghi]|uniref:Uncharacterized protein n=1 Tax=Peronosclerospora sorghi TaxID=230839 RepID=A0ACC0WAA5_9STRA|nr:hypothetical protein PsorP6_008045 [Peronosclerospora sorghi]
MKKHTKEWADIPPESTVKNRKRKKLKNNPNQDETACGCQSEDKTFRPAIASAHVRELRMDPQPLCNSSNAPEPCLKST